MWLPLRNTHWCRQLLTVSSQPLLPSVTTGSPLSPLSRPKLTSLLFASCLQALSVPLLPDGSHVADLITWVLYHFGHYLCYLSRFPLNFPLLVCVCACVCVTAGWVFQVCSLVMALSEGLLKLRWNNHEATFCHILHRLRSKVSPDWEQFAQV